MTETVHLRRQSQHLPTGGNASFNDRLWVTSIFIEVMEAAQTWLSVTPSEEAKRTYEEKSVDRDKNARGFGTDVPDEVVRSHIAAGSCPVEGDEDTRRFCKSLPAFRAGHQHRTPNGHRKLCPGLARTVLNRLSSHSSTAPVSDCCPILARLFTDLQEPPCETLPSRRYHLTRQPRPPAS